MKSKIVAFLGLSVILFMVLALPLITSAQTVPCPDGKYCALSTIPGISETGKEVDPVFLITNIYGISIGIAAILAVGMIIWAGIQYATTEAITGKSEAKKHWQGAIFGLLLLISSYLILKTLNISLIQQDLSLGNARGCTETLPTGQVVPCGAGSDDVVLNQVRADLTAEKARLTAAQDLVNQKILELEERLENAKEVNNEAEIDRLEAEIEATRSAGTQTQTSFLKTNGLIAITTRASTGMNLFDVAVKNNSNTDIKNSIQSFQDEAKMIMDSAADLKAPNGSNVYTQTEIDKMRSQFNYQLFYMNSYLAWKQGGSKGTAPIRPSFDITSVIPPRTPTN